MEALKSNKNRTWIRLITLIVITTFLCQNVAWAYPEVPQYNSLQVNSAFDEDPRNEHIRDEMLEAMNNVSNGGDINDKSNVAQTRKEAEPPSSMKNFGKKVLFLSLGVIFWSAVSWVSLGVLLLTTRFWRPLKRMYYRWGPGYSDEEIEMLFAESNYNLLRRYGWTALRWFEWLYQSQKSVEVPISKGRFRLEGDNQVLHEQKIEMISLSKKALNSAKEVNLNISMDRIRDILYEIGEKKAAEILDKGITFMAVALNGTPNSPFLYLDVEHDAKEMTYGFSAFSYKQGKRGRGIKRSLKALLSLRKGSIQKEEPEAIIYFNKNLIKSWQDDKGHFRKIDALEALIAEIVIKIAEGEESKRREVEKQIKRAQLLLSGLGEIGNNRLEDIIDREYLWKLNRGITKEDLKALESVLEEAPAPGDIADLKSGLDDLKRWEAYGYWHRFTGKFRGQEVSMPQGITQWILNRIKRSIDNLDQKYYNFSQFLRAMALRYFIIHPQKISFPVGFIKRWFGRIISITFIPKKHLFAYIDQSVHSGFFNEFNNYNKYNYFWLLEAGFSGLRAAYIISYTNIRTDDMVKGFIPALGDMSRHYNMYLHDGREELDFRKYAGKENMQKYVVHYQEEKRTDISGVDTRKDWANSEFSLAVENYINNRIYESLSALGRGVHSLQDITAHFDFDTGRYGTQIHHKDFDNPEKDLTGVNKAGEPVFEDGTRRIELTKQISIAYYRAYLNIIDFINQEEIRSYQDPRLTGKMKKELGPVRDLVAPLITVSQILPHLTALDNEALEALSEEINEDELNLLKWLVGKEAEPHSLFKEIYTLDKPEGVNILAPLQDEPVRQFLFELFSYTYGQFGVRSEEVQRMFEALAKPHLSLQEAAEAVYTSGMDWKDPDSRISRIHSAYRQQVRSKTFFEFLRDLIEGPIIIDIGCGKNALAREIVENVPDIEKAIGTDVSDDIEESTDKRVMFRLQENRDTIPVEDNIADTVLIITVLHHVEKERVRILLREANRILKPGGRIIVLENTTSNVAPKYNEKGLVDKFRELDLTQQKQVLTIYDWIANHVAGGHFDMPLAFNFLSEEEWLREFEYAGLTIKDTIFLGIYPLKFHCPPHTIFVLEKGKHSSGLLHGVGEEKESATAEGVPEGAEAVQKSPDMSEKETFRVKVDRKRISSKGEKLYDTGDPVKEIKDVFGNVEEKGNFQKGSGFDEFCNLLELLPPEVENILRLVFAERIYRFGKRIDIQKLEGRSFKFQLSASFEDLFGNDRNDSIVTTNYRALLELPKEERLIALAIGVSHEVLGHECDFHKERILTSQDIELTLRFLDSRLLLERYINKLSRISNKKYSPYLRQLLKRLEGFPEPKNPRYRKLERLLLNFSYRFNEYGAKTYETVAVGEDGSLLTAWWGRPTPRKEPEIAINEDNLLMFSVRRDRSEVEVTADMGELELDDVISLVKKAVEDKEAHDRLVKHIQEERLKEKKSRERRMRLARTVWNEIDESIIQQRRERLKWIENRNKRIKGRPEDNMTVRTLFDVISVLYGLIYFKGKGPVEITPKVINSYARYQYEHLIEKAVIRRKDGSPATIEDTNYDQLYIDIKKYSELEGNAVEFAFGFGALNLVDDPQDDSCIRVELYSRWPYKIDPPHPLMAPLYIEFAARCVERDIPVKIDEWAKEAFMGDYEVDPLDPDPYIPASGETDQLFKEVTDLKDSLNQKTLELMNLHQTIVDLDYPEEKAGFLYFDMDKILYETEDIAMSYIEALEKLQQASSTGNYALALVNSHPEKSFTDIMDILRARYPELRQSINYLAQNAVIVDAREIASITEDEIGKALIDKAYQKVKERIVDKDIDPEGIILAIYRKNLYLYPLDLLKKYILLILSPNTFTLDKNQIKELAPYLPELEQQLKDAQDIPLLREFYCTSQEYQRALEAEKEIKDQA